MQATACSMDSCKSQIQWKLIRIKTLEDEGGNSDREKIKMEGIQEQLEEEAQMLMDEEELWQAESIVEKLAAILEGR